MPEPAGAMGALRAWYPEVPSTMDVAMALAVAGSPHGTVVEAAYQSAGRGRLGRPWIAPPSSSLLTSWVLRVPAGRSVAVLSPLAALALIRVVEAIAPGAPVAWKWPNDVLVDGRKLAGILLTTRMGADETIVIAGIGVNVTTESVPDRELATCVHEWHPGVAIGAVRAALADELEAAWAAFLAHDALSMIDRPALEERMAWRGETVEILAEGGAVRGTLLGVESDGALRIRLEPDGAIRLLHSGEVTRGPRRMADNGPELCRILP